MKYFTVYFDEKYSPVVGMACNRYYVHGSYESMMKVHQIRKENPKWAKENPKEWASYTGVYRGTEGMAVYKVSDRNQSIVRNNLNTLKDLNIITDFKVEGLG